MTLVMRLGQVVVDQMEIDGNVSTLIEHVCCRCGKTLYYSDGKGKWGESHGLCEECLEREFEEASGLRG